MRGSVLDLAVGVIIGAAFQKIVTSLVDDIISPLLGLIGGVNFDMLMIKIGEVEIRYGAFITSIINFVIMAFVIFLLVKGINTVKRLSSDTLHKKGEEPIISVKICPYCLSEIPKGATRCKFCSSELEPDNAKDEVVQG